MQIDRGGLRSINDYLAGRTSSFTVGKFVNTLLLSDVELAPTDEALKRHSGDRDALREELMRGHYTVWHSRFLSFYDGLALFPKKLLQVESASRALARKAAALPSHKGMEPYDCPCCGAYRSVDIQYAGLYLI